MVHGERVFSIAKVDTAEELAEKLRPDITWCCCNGFDLDGVLFLNDAFSVDGAQEYAVVILNDDTKCLGIQVESITVSWVKEREKMVQYINDCLEYKKEIGEAPIHKAVLVMREHGANCHLCR